MNTQDLIALRTRLERIYNACCSTAPKQAVGEMVAAMLAMPEWAALAAAQPKEGTPAYEWGFSAGKAWQKDREKADERGSAEPRRKCECEKLPHETHCSWEWPNNPEPGLRHD